MIKIRFTLLVICMLLITQKSRGQSGTIQANPAVTNAIIAPTGPLAGVGSNFSITFTIGTNGGLEGIDGSKIARRMGFSICLGKATWATGDALTSISGDLLAKFDVAVIPEIPQCIQGKQKAGVALAATELHDLTISATVTELSSTSGIGGIGASCNIARAAASTGTLSDDFLSVYTSTVTAQPVSLLRFTAQAEPDRTVLLNWATSWEKANKGYIVERSKDLTSFERVGEVTDVAGTSNSLSSYRFVDRNPYRGTSYYRLRQVDLDGSSHTFDAESVVIDGRYGVYPNPVVNHNFTLDLDEPTTAVLHLYNAMGSELAIMKSEFTELSTKITPAAKLVSGVYILTVDERNTTRKHRLLVP